MQEESHIMNKGDCGKLYTYSCTESLVQHYETDQVDAKVLAVLHYHAHQ